VPQRRPRTFDKRKPGFDTPIPVAGSVLAVGTIAALAGGMKTGNQIIGGVLHCDGRQST